MFRAYVLIIRSLKLRYTASGIITLIGGRLVHRLREDLLECIPIKIFVLQKVYFMPLHVSSICAHHQEFKFALHSLWCHHTYRWPSGAQVERGLVGMHSNQNFCFTISLFHASTCFEHMCSSSGGQNYITQPLVSSHL